MTEAKDNGDPKSAGLSLLKKGKDMWEVAAALIVGPIAKAATRLGLNLLSPEGIRERGEARADVLVARAEARRRAKLIDEQCKADLNKIARGEAQWAGGRLSRLVGEKDTPPRLAAPGSSTANDAADETSTLTNMSQLANLVDDMEKVKKLLALRDVFRIAEEIVDMRGYEPKESGEIDDALLMEFKDGAERSPEGTMRELWARLLVEEVDRPGSQSRRTIHALRQFSREDADVVSRIGSLIYDGHSLLRSDSHLDFNMDEKFKEAFAGQNFLERHQVSIHDLMHLDAIGVLSGASSLGLTETLKKHKHSDQIVWVLDFCGKKRLIAMAKPDRPDVKLPSYSLTAVGRQIVRLGSFEPDRLYIQMVADYIALHGPDWIRLFDILPNDAGTKMTDPHEVLYQASTGSAPAS